MSLAKESQLSLDGEDIVLSDPLLDLEEDSMMDELNLSDEKLSNNEVLFELEQNPDGELILTLDKIPGGLDQEDFVVEDDLVIEEPEEVEINDDPWAWDVVGFLPWLSKMMQGVPSHDGRSTVGIERAIAYLERLDKEISKAVRMDLNNQIAIDAVEKAREEIHNGMERLEERLDKVQTAKYPRRKKNKKAEENSDNLVKEAGTANFRGIVVSVPLLISSLARSCINGCVSAGKDIEELFVKLADEYNLDKREKLELATLIQDMGFFVRRDFGVPLDQPTDTTSVDNVNWPANYYA